ncbi:unnamed protein product [Didymodactylos carnosus]|uniref:EF-hand domain-containing protein n=1 Tax=Didymodactylos carnosus TaxID=1234261 RepID=A0A815JQ59_9BILA|nr:unnamed protein product [Didymodactylos carnosus]CAF1384403.1 unnamed protein product [Didymodactylos carnosus]CAF4155879.1 unnamed protein product [Didymodactylos carnosus]CAF4279682.1 unnamed protein product [Didymodactylos carnosus]
MAGNASYDLNTISAETSEQRSRHSTAASIQPENVSIGHPQLNPILPSPARRRLESISPRMMTRREMAEVQLNGLLNDPVISLSYLERQTGHNMSEQYTVKQIAEILHTSPYLTGRLLIAIGYPDDVSVLNGYDVQKIIRILTGTLDTRALVFFIMLDNDGDKLISSTELKTFFTKYLQETDKYINEERRTEAINMLIDKFHLDDENKRMNFEEFHQIVCAHPLLQQAISQFIVHPRCVEIYNKPQEPKSTKWCEKLCPSMFRQPYDRNRVFFWTRDFIKDNFIRLLYLLVYILINIGLIIWVFIERVQKQKLPWALVIARLNGMLLNFNCTLVIILMLKQTITLIRSTFLWNLIPVDDHIDFHKAVGRVIAVTALLHTIAHFINAAQHTGK